MRNDRVAILIKKAVLEIEKLANQVLAPYELTSSQYKVLMMLYENLDKPIRQADIEAELSMTNPTVTGIVQNLEKKDMVRRIENPKDKRSKLLVLTEKTLSMREEVEKLGEILEGQVTGSLTKEEYDQMILLLRKILAEG